MKTFSLRKILPIQLLLTLMLLALVHPLAAIEPAQLAGSQWLVVGNASMKASVPGGSVSIPGPAVVSFNSDGQLQIEDATGTTMGGTWSVDQSGNPVIQVTAQDVEQFIYNYLPSGYANYIDNLTVNKVTSKAKLTVNGDVGSLSINLSFQLSMTVQEHNIKISYNLTAKGTGDVSGQALVGSEWNLSSASLKFVAGKIKVSTTDPLHLSLDAGRFTLSSSAGSQTLFSGRYFRVGNKINFLPDTDSLESYLTDIAYQHITVVNPDANVAMLASPSLLSAQIQNGTLKLSGKITFLGEYDYTDAKDNSRTIPFKGTVSLSGTGQ